jgi:microcystin-dependent protein
MKTQIREVIDVDHDFPSSGQAADVGQHKKVTLQEQADLGSGAVSATLLGSQTTDGKGELTYTDEADNDIQITKDGKIHAPSLAGVYPAANVAALVNILPLIYPVGSIYINAGVSTSPAVIFGFGTWAAFGAGKVIIGIDSGDTDFDALTDTGGAKTVTLTGAQSGLPAHTVPIPLGGDDTDGGIASNGSSQNATQNISISAANAAEAHNNLPPYVTAYFWKRTA